MLNIIAKLKRLILLIGDIVVLYFSLWLTLLIRYQKPTTQELWREHWLPFTIIFVLWIIIFFINKLYDLSTAQNNLQFFSTLTKSLVWCAMVGFIFFYIATTGISPKTILILNIIIFGLLVSLWRRLYNKIIVTQKFLENTIIVGLSSNTLQLAKEINNKPQMGLKVAGIVQPGEPIPGLRDENIQIITSTEKLKSFLKDKKIRTVILGAQTENYPGLINELYKSLDLKISILDLPTFAEKFTGKILINTIGQMWFLENIQESRKQIYEIAKRLLDIILSSLLLLVSIPFLPIIYFTIKFDSPGSGFFMQQRIGKDGKKFMAVKFRSMYANSETSGPQWAQLNDVRVTKVGKFLRKTRIDEIPQLINVLRGEMSFIGPRPERPEFIAELKKNIPFYEARLLVKPGITGWAQINFPYGSSEKDALEKLQYDLYYIKNRSFILDFSILLKTIKTVLSGGGQ